MEHKNLASKEAPK